MATLHTSYTPVHQCASSEHARSQRFSLSLSLSLSLSPFLLSTFSAKLLLPPPPIPPWSLALLLVFVSLIFRGNFSNFPFFQTKRFFSQIFGLLKFNIVELRGTFSLSLFFILYKMEFFSEFLSFSHTDGKERKAFFEKRPYGNLWQVAFLRSNARMEVEVSRVRERPIRKWNGRL